MTDQNRCCGCGCLEGERHYDECTTPVVPDRIAELREEFYPGGMHFYIARYGNLVKFSDYKRANTVIAELLDMLEARDQYDGTLALNRKQHDRIHVLEADLRVAQRTQEMSEIVMRRQKEALEAKDEDLFAADKYSPVPGTVLSCRKIDGELWCRVTDFERMKGNKS